MLKSAEHRTTRVIRMRIYLVCFAIGVLFAASNIHLVVAAGRFVDAHQDQVERNLVRSEIDQMAYTAARDQAQISRWDRTVEAVYRGEAHDFVRDEFAGWFWNDFGISMNAIVAADMKIDVAVVEGRMVDPALVSDDVRAHADIIERAQARFDRMKVRFGDGYTVQADALDRSDPIYVTEIRRYHNKPAVVVAQAIVPDGTALVPLGPAKILLTVKVITPALVEHARRSLGLDSFVIGGASRTDGSERLHTIWLNEAPGERPVRVTWTSAPDSQAMWEGVLPVMAAIFVVMVSCLFFVARGQSKGARALAEREAENRFLAFHDPLTGLANRLKFDRAVEALAERNPAGGSWAVACIDLDEFKAVNDTFGHHAGDNVLCKTADVLHTVAGQHGLVARIGGDEFMVLFAGDTDRAHLRRLCDTMIARMSQDMYFDGGKARIGASIGVAWFPRDGSSVKEIMRAADSALYRAKQSGRGVTCFAGERESEPAAGVGRRNGKAA